MVSGPIFNPREVVSTPVDGDIEKAISSDWAFDHVEDIDAHMCDFLQKLRTGQYTFMPYDPTASNAAFTIVVDTLYAHQFFLPRDMTFDRIAIRISTAVGGSSVRLGIYEDGVNLYPGALLLDAGVVSSATTGLKEITINQAVPKGLYWLVAVSDAGPAAWKYTSVSASPTGITLDATPSVNRGWRVAQAFGALPDPFTGGGTLLTGNTVQPAVRLRPLSMD